jgi:NADH-quinone oxidoreductase subunit J
MSAFALAAPFAISLGWVTFWLAAVVAVLAALVVVLHRSPVVEAMGLVINLLAIAAVFVLLGAYFFAALQVIIYAGAIVVLITFVIMLLNLRPEARGGPGIFTVVATFVLGAALIVLLTRAGLSFQPGGEGAAPALDPGFGSVERVGDALFTTYYYPFLAVSLALLAAMAGAVLLAKRDLED